MKSLLLLAAMLAAGEALPAADVRDFLIEDVCVDAAGTPIAGDPATCAAHRDAREGESLPYMHVDADGPRDTLHYQSFFSFPAEGFIVAAKDFGGDDPYTTFGVLDACSRGNCDQQLRDGYDLIEIGTAYVSIVATSDPAHNDQRYCGDGWILFSADDVPGSAHSHLGICPQTRSAAYTTWSRQPFDFTASKQLEAMVSTHFAGDDEPSATSFERFYFTREYGYTRWEAWRRADLCAGGCIAKPWGCSGAQVENHGKSLFIRTDCRDTANVIAGGFDPQPFVPVDAIARQRIWAGAFSAAFALAGFAALRCLSRN